MKWRPGQERGEALTHPATGSSTTSCGHKIQPWRDGLSSSLWTGGSNHRVLPDISALGAPILHCAPCAVGVSVLQVAPGQTCRSSSHLPAQCSGAAATVMGLLFPLCTKKGASPQQPGGGCSICWVSQTHWGLGQPQAPRWAASQGLSASLAPLGSQHRTVLPSQHCALVYRGIFASTTK